MSDAPTPRTDKEIVEVYDEMSDSTDFYVKPDFARKLERESDQLAKQCVVFVNEIADDRTALANYKAELERLLDEIAELRKDSARLDWLLGYATRGASYIQCMGFRVNNRKSIDASMERITKS